MFRPRRTSSPSRTAATSSRASAPNTSFSSTTPELASLTPDEIDFIDAVIAQAGPTASTFLSVLNAYNDVLRQRGMDSRDEVVYYGKLLKLGTLKGRTWAEKWAVVRGSQPPVAGPSRITQKHSSITSRLNAPISVARDPDTFTLHSHEDDDDSQDTFTPRVGRRPLSPASELSNSLGLSTAPLDAGPSRAPTRSRPAPTIPARRPQLWESISVTSDSEEHTGSLTAAIPTHRATYRQNPPITPRQRLTSDPKPVPAGNANRVVAPTASHRAVEKARMSRTSNLNDEDAWAKIRHARDEEDADVFRREQLLSRCWAVWRAGLEWVVTTHVQIAQARDTLVLRRAVHRWREKTARHQVLAANVETAANERLLRRVMAIWTVKLAERRQIHWRSDMRARMKIVRERREQNLLLDAWMKWKLAARVQGAERMYDGRVLTRAMDKWKGKQRKLRDMEDVADAYEESGERRVALRAWERWKWATDLRQREAAMVEHVSIRVMSDTWNAWKRRMRNYQLASDFYDIVCIKNAMRSWKAARDRIRKLERKADKHLARQDDVLVRAIVRVWRAHERGKLLERVRDSRVIRQMWYLWQQRLLEHRRQEQVAVSFAMRPGSALAASVFRAWKRANKTHQDNFQIAAQYHTVQIQHKAMLTWRIQLRRHTKLAKQARIAEKHLVLQSAWIKWRHVIEEKARQRKLQAFQRKKTRKIFNKWFERAQKQRHLHLAEGAVKSAVAMRVVRAALTKWTNRVIAYKLRELDTIQRSDSKLLVSTFKKWRTIHARHAESLSLLDSYMDVKREETVRKVFHKWLNAARNKHHLKAVLAEREQEVRLLQLTVAWDKWRDRFKDERLRPIEREVLLQTQRNLIFRSFGIWLSKTNSLPAIRFEAFHVKAKMWRKWRALMPQAMQAKAARDFHARNVTAKFFQLWLERHRKKVALKAVARARYLRLPTVSPRENAPSRPPALAITRPASTMGSYPNPSSSIRPLATRRNYRENTPDPPAATSAPSVISEPPPNRLSPFSTRGPLSSASRTGGAGTGLSSLLSATPRARLGDTSTSTSRPRLFLSPSITRDPSPARSRSSFGPRTVTADEAAEDGQDSSPTRVPPTLSSGSAPKAEGRSRLWEELQTIQRRSRSPEGKKR